MFTIWKVDENTEKLKIYDKSKGSIKSPIKEYRELALWVRNLDKGRYIIVPATKKYGEYGRYFLNIYFSTNIQKRPPKYLTHYEGEDVNCEKGDFIWEEEEDVKEDLS